MLLMMNTNVCNTNDGCGGGVTKLELPGFKQVAGGWFLSWGSKDKDKDCGFSLEIKREATIFHGSKLDE